MTSIAGSEAISSDRFLCNNEETALVDLIITTLDIMNNAPSVASLT